MKMKGFLSNTQGWVVRYDVFQHDYSYTLPAWNFIALHPECVKYAEVGKVEFEIVKYDGKTSLSEGWGGYAKLIGKEKINTWDDIFDNIESEMDCVVPLKVVNYLEKNYIKPTPLQTDENGKPLKYWGGLAKEVSFEEINNQSINYPEISDEEIKNAAIKYAYHIPYENPLSDFMEGVKWYKEQLKLRQ